MAARATFKYLRVSPRKMHRVVNLVRGKDVDKALQLLTYEKKVSARDVIKLIKSAVANAGQKGGMRTDILFIKEIMVNQGPMLKRWLPRARGSASRIQKKMSHVTVVLEERI